MRETKCTCPADLSYVCLACERATMAMEAYGDNLAAMYDYPDFDIY